MVTRLCKFSHPGVQSSRERLGTLDWFLALRYLFLRDWISVFPPALQNSQARFCALETVLWFFRKISLYSLLNLKVFVLRNQSAIILCSKLSRTTRCSFDGFSDDGCIGYVCCANPSLIYGSYLFYSWPQRQLPDSLFAEGHHWLLLALK